MESGTIAAWTKKVGDRVTPGDLIADVETDKATIGFETTDEGYIAKLLVPAGKGQIKVGAPVAIIVPDKKDIEAFADYTPEESAPAASTDSASASAPPAEKPAPSSSTPPAKSSSAPSGESYPPHVTVGMPALSPTMEAGAIVGWTKKAGDRVTPGDLIADVETDKATIGFETTDEGYIAKLLVPAGKNQITVGSPVAIIVNNEKDIAAFADYTAESAAPSPAPAASSAPAPSSSAPATQSSSSSSPSTPTPTASGDRVVASPYARLTAKEKGVNLGEVSGTGPGGRIIAADVNEYSPAKKAEATKAKAPSATATTSTGRYHDIPASNIRKITAQRLTAAKQEIPHYYVTVECRVDALLELRAELNALAKEGEYKLSVTDFVTKATALALKAVPAVNSEWREDSIRQYHNVDINLAVNTPNGLLTPVIRDCDSIGLKLLSSRAKEAAQRAQFGKSSLDDLQMGTFTISNLGMFGVQQFCAVINPPQAGILAVGNIEKKVVEIEPGVFKTLNFLTVTLSADHRVVDGAVGAQWLQAFKALIENPLKFLL